MAYNGFAIDEYPDAAAATKQLDELIKKPIYSVRPEALKEYEENCFEKKCVGSVGAAAIVGVGLGLIPDLESVCDFIPASEVYEPDPEKHARYQPYFETFKKLYKANKDLYRSIPQED